MLHAKQLLGPAAQSVDLIGIGANPEKTQVKWVRDYSRAHGMLHKWRFLTGSLPELKRVWRLYGIEAAVVQGAIDHTPATYVIDQQGRFSRLYVSEMAYSSVDQLGYEMAQSISALLPGHPRLRGTQSLAAISLLGPKQQVTLPRFGGGSVRLGPGSGPHLVLFFDTWETEITDLSKQLETLNRYQAVAKRKGLPPLVAIDEDGSGADTTGTAELPPWPAAPARVSGRSRPQRPRRRRLPRAGFALAGARLGQGPLPVLRGSRGEGLADAEAAARAGAGRARPSKDFSANLRQPAGSCSRLTQTGDTGCAVLC